MEARTSLPITVGIPGALLYYEYFPLWKAFLEGLGVKVVTSGPTNKRLLNLGVAAAVDETCLPVKVFFGHALALKDRVDYLFIPRLVSVEKKAYTCPKFLGLPDMLRNAGVDLPPVIDTTVDLSKKPWRLYEAVLDIGRHFTSDTFLILRAYRRAVQVWRRFRSLVRRGATLQEAIEVLEGRGAAGALPADRRREERVRVAVLGHPYILYDAQVSLDLLKKLKAMGAEVITPEQIPEEKLEEALATLEKPLFWTYEKKILGAALYLLERRQVDGIINVASFGCGPDSMVGEIVERRVKKARLPFMLLTVDEHTGEAGLSTRVEAFIDMIARRKKAGLAVVPR